MLIGNWNDYELDKKLHRTNTDWFLWAQCIRIENVYLVENINLQSHEWILHFLFFHASNDCLFSLKIDKCLLFVRRSHFLVTANNNNNLYFYITVIIIGISIEKWCDYDLLKEDRQPDTSSEQGRSLKNATLF